MSRTWAELFGDEPTAADEPERTGFFGRLRDSLAKSRRALTAEIAAGTFDAADEEAWERLEEALIHGDVGVRATAEIVRRLEARGELGRPRRGARGGDRGALRRRRRRSRSARKPTVILVVGVNGTGKTTTVGKLAQKLREHGRTVLVGAGDTFRAAAEEQLEIWAERAGADFVGAPAGGDPAAVAFDAVEAGRARGRDVVIIDTAGRLHTQANLMEELAKVRRVIEGRIEGAPHETLLVVDATTGQNGLQQARLFGEAAGVTGVALTKLDGSAQGRRRGRDRLRARPAGEARRRGGGPRRPAAVRPARVRAGARRADERMRGPRLRWRRSSARCAYLRRRLFCGCRTEVSRWRLTLYHARPRARVSARYDRMIARARSGREPARRADPAHRLRGRRRRSTSARSGRRVRRPRASSSAAARGVSALGVKEPLSYRLEPLHNLFAPDMDMIGRIGSSSLPVGDRSAVPRVVAARRLSLTVHRRSASRERGAPRAGDRVPPVHFTAVFDALSDRLQATLGDLGRAKRLDEDAVNKAMREIRLALLEADVNFQVVKDFVAGVKADGARRGHPQGPRRRASRSSSSCTTGWRS